MLYSLQLRYLGTDVTILAIAVRDIRATERRLIKTIKMC
jgi:hypothetical protein